MLLIIRERKLSKKKISNQTSVLLLVKHAICIYEAKCKVEFCRPIRSEGLINQVIKPRLKKKFIKLDFTSDFVPCYSGSLCPDFL